MKRKSILLFLVFAVLVIIGFLAFYFLLLPEFQNGGKISELNLTNISSGSVAISFVTEKDAVAGVYYSVKGQPWNEINLQGDKLKAVDDWDTIAEATGVTEKPEGAQTRKIHYITLQDLDPETEYEFRVFAGRKVYKLETNNFKTTAVSDKVAMPDQLYGSIIGANLVKGDGTKNMVIFYDIIDTATDTKSLSNSTFVNDQGNWLADLSLIKNEDGSAFTLNKESSQLNVTIRYNGQDQSQILTYDLSGLTRIPDIYLDDNKVAYVEEPTQIFAGASIERSCTGTCGRGIFGLDNPGLSFNYCSNPQTKSYSSRTVCRGTDDACYTCKDGTWITARDEQWRCDQNNAVPKCSGTTIYPTADPRQTTCLNTGGTWLGTYCQCYSPKTLNSRGECTAPTPTTDPRQTSCFNSGGVWYGSYCQCYSPKVYSTSASGCITPEPTKSPLEIACTSTGGGWVGSGCVCFGGRVLQSSGQCAVPTSTPTPTGQKCINGIDYRSTMSERKDTEMLCGQDKWYQCQNGSWKGAGTSWNGYCCQDKSLKYGACGATPTIVVTSTPVPPTFTATPTPTVDPRQTKCEAVDSKGTWTFSTAARAYICSCYAPTKYNATSQKCEVPPVTNTPVPPTATPTSTTVITTPQVTQPSCVTEELVASGSAACCPGLRFCDKQYAEKPGLCTAQGCRPRYAQVLKLQLQLTDDASKTGLKDLTFSYVKINPSTRASTGLVNSRLSTQQLNELITRGKVDITLDNFDFSFDTNFIAYPNEGYICTTQLDKITGLVYKFGYYDDPGRTLPFAITCRQNEISQGLTGYGDQGLLNDIYKTTTDFFPALKDSRTRIILYSCYSINLNLTITAICARGSVVCFVPLAGVQGYIYCDIDKIKNEEKISSLLVKFTFLHEMTHINQNVNGAERLPLNQYTLLSTACPAALEFGADLAALKMTNTFNICSGLCSYSFKDKKSGTTGNAADLLNSLKQGDLASVLVSQDVFQDYMVDAFSIRDPNKTHALLNKAYPCDYFEITNGSVQNAFIEKGSATSPHDFFKEIDSTDLKKIDQAAKDSSEMKLEPGKYTFVSSAPTLSDFTNFEIVVPEKDGETLSTSLFIDKNKDGIKQSGEENIPNLGELKIEKVADSFTYDLKQGWNLITLPFVTEEYADAETLVKTLKKNGIPIKSVAEFASGKFDTLIQEDYDKTFGNNFALKTNTAYYINSEVAGSITMTGTRSSAEKVKLSAGWNTIALDYLQGKTSQDVIDLCKKQNIECTGIAKSSSAGFETNIVDGGLIYGTPFKIEPKAGYFLQVKTGKDIELNLAAI